MLLHCQYTGTTLVTCGQCSCACWCDSGTTLKLRWYDTRTPLTLHWYYMCTTLVLHACHTGTALAYTGTFVCGTKDDYERIAAMQW